MGHYYTKAGEACYWQPKKDGNGTRPTNIADARKLGLVPSPTNVISMLDKPYLTEWKIRQAVYAVVTAPDLPGEGLDQKLERILEQERQQDEASRIARDRGTEIHEALERHFGPERLTLEQIDGARRTLGQEPIAPWINYPVARVHELGGTVIGSERILVGDGYAGKADLILDVRGTVWIVDFKSASTVPKKGSWFEHRLQLAAYAAAHGGDVKTANLYISTKEPGLYAWCENPAWQPDYDCFMHLLHVWQHVNNYKA